MNDIVYLLWSNKHNDIEQAGRFAEPDAVNNVVASAQCGIREQVTCMVAAPDNWAREPMREVRAEALDKRQVAIERLVTSDGVL